MECGRPPPGSRPRNRGREKCRAVRSGVRVLVGRNDRRHSRGVVTVTSTVPVSPAGTVTVTTVPFVLTVTDDVVTDPKETTVAPPSLFRGS